MGKMFQLLKDGLEEAIAFHKGQAKPRTREVFVPAAPKEYEYKDIKKLRAKLGVTQQQLAAWLNISLNTVQAWEQNLRHPNHSSLRLLEVLDSDFSSVKKILKNKQRPARSKKSSYFSSQTPSKPSMVAKAR